MKKGEVSFPYAYGCTHFDVGSELIIILDLTSCMQNQLNVLINDSTGLSSLILGKQMFWFFRGRSAFKFPVPADSQGSFCLSDHVF